MMSLLKAAVAALLFAPAALALPNWGHHHHGVEPFFYKGFDLSSLHILEEGNVTYKDTARHNKTRPAEDILGDGGMNTVRLRFISTCLPAGKHVTDSDNRIWVNPIPGQYDLEYTLSQAQRFSKKGYKVHTSHSLS